MEPREHLDRIADLQRQLRQARDARDEAMRRAHADGVTMYRLAKRYEMTQPAVKKIITGRRPEQS